MLRPLTALEVSSLAINYIDEKVKDGTFDDVMAKWAKAYIREVFRRDFPLGGGSFTDRLLG